MGVFLVVLSLLAIAALQGPPKPEKAKPKKKRRYDPGFTQSRYIVLREQRKRLGFNQCVLCSAIGGQIDSLGRVISITADHITPHAWQPGIYITPAMLQPLCSPCNIGKGKLDNINYQNN